MSFQFNFTIEESEHSITECELSPGRNLGSVNSLTTEENTENEPEALEDCDMQREIVNQEPDILTSDKNSVSSCGSTSSKSQKKAACKSIAIEHKIPEDVSRVLENKIVESILGLGFINISVVEMTLSDKESNGENIISKTLTSNSDLISGVYEGGMKIWECTFDLIKYFEDKNVNFEGKSVLDLGCGAGLLGILALKRKAKEVHFQDYNSTVIQEITVPNTIVNCDGDTDEPDNKRPKIAETEAGLLSKCKFFSGEWSQFNKLMQNKTPAMKYDIILTSETIYNPAYYDALHDLFQNLLAKNGIVYLASKSHYFGVGGGIHLFESFIAERKVFYAKTLQAIEEGLQRMLISLSFCSS
ncbi:hypothetical protein GDO86_004172 [Hymenochirus boettgeri]|uniref:protein-histidine N-methyltransferase n=1 Tax=Hymenochirus boettgeri TaxID=247094 RepID=A0A8T2K436_9PIPI|nr:hypothetical protein GDO86_004172 [Hymenochirus boettgeri]